MFRSRRKRVYQFNAHSATPIPPPMRRAVPVPTMARLVNIVPSDDSALFSIFTEDISCSLDCDCVS